MRGTPVGWIHPINQASSTAANSATDSATRNASACIIRWLRGSSAAPRRNIATPAAAKAPRMPTRATTMSHFIAGDYPRGPRWRAAVVLAAALLGAAVTARAGFWQLDRAQQKLSLQAQIDERERLEPLRGTELPARGADAAGVHQRQVRLEGEWMPGTTVFLENRQMGGRPGFFVLTVFRVAGAPDAVVVQRGWAPRDLLDRERVPEVPTPRGVVTLDGRVAPPPSRLVELGEAGTGRIRQNLDLEAFAREIGVPLKALSVLQTGGGSLDGLRRDWPAPAVDVHKHYGYAVQWFALCALITGLYVWFQILRPRRRR
jgi:surfeit locus 1 family protein